MDERNNDFDFDFTPIGLAIKKARTTQGMQHLQFLMKFSKQRKTFRNSTRKAVSLISIIMKNSALPDSVMMLLDMRHHRDCEMS